MSPAPIERTLLDPFIDQVQTIDWLDDRYCIVERAVLKVRPNLDCLPSTGGENPMKIVSSDRFQSLLSMASPAMTSWSWTVHQPYTWPTRSGARQTLSAYRVHRSGRTPTKRNGRRSDKAVFSQEDQTKMVTLLTRARKSHINYQGYYSAYGAKS